MEYRFVFLPAIGNDNMPFYGSSVATKKIAEEQLSLIADYTLHLHNRDIMMDYSNAGYIEMYIDGDWEAVEEHQLVHQQKYRNRLKMVAVSTHSYGSDLISIL